MKSHGSSETSKDVHIADDAGVDARALLAPQDPIAAYIALMEVVELLRPPRPLADERAHVAETHYIYKL